MFRDGLAVTTEAPRGPKKHRRGGGVRALRLSALAYPVDHSSGIEAAPFATTHAWLRQEVERTVSNLMAQFGGRASFSDELCNLRAFNVLMSSDPSHLELKFSTL